MSFRSVAASVVLAGLVAGQGEAAEPAAKDPAPRIEDFSWLAGHWRGEGFGGTCEEVWTLPLGGTMVGSFRLVKDDAVEFYEIVVLEPESDGMVLKVKHFSSDFSAWEEKDEAISFHLETVEPNRAVFKGLVFERSDDRLEIRLRMRSKSGEIRWETLSLRAYRP